jgi:hypothetical protein
MSRYGDEKILEKQEGLPPSCWLVDVNEASPLVAAVGAQDRRKGTFESGAHETSGSAILLSVQDSMSTLRLENLVTETTP